VLAARWFADAFLRFPLPRTGWHEEGADATGATVVWGLTTLHVVRPGEGRWSVDRGTTCT
jgi:hypothetical protein